MPEYDSTVEYRDVPNFPGYKVGNDGTVWSRRNKFYRKGFGSGVEDEGPVRKLSAVWKQLNQEVLRNGYLRVSLCKNNKVTRVSVHRLVLLCFVGPCPEGMEACHFPDNDKTNNRISNLRWASKISNANDSKIQGTVVSGFKNPKVKVTRELILAFRKEHLELGISGDAIGRKYGFSAQYVRRIAKKEVWADIC